MTLPAWRIFTPGPAGECLGDWGVETLVSGAASRGRERLLERATKRQAALEKVAARAKMDFRARGPEWLDEATVGPDQLACSYVFEFKP